MKAVVNLLLSYSNKAKLFILSTGRLESLQPFNVSVCLSVTTERLPKLRKITGKKQARFPLRPQWPPVTGSKKVTVVRGPFFCPQRLKTIQKTSSNVGGGGAEVESRASFYALMGWDHQPNTKGCCCHLARGLIEV